LADLNVQLRQYYDANDIDGSMSRVVPLMWQQLRSKQVKFPALKAKAAQTRHLVPFCLALAHLHRDGSADRRQFSFRRNHRLTPHLQRHLDLQVALFTGLNGFLQTAAAEPFDAQANKMAMYLYLQSLNDLNALWRNGLNEQAASAQPYHLRPPKSHACHHLVEDKLEVFGSPIAFWGYRDEDYVGYVKRIAQRTSHPATIEQRCLEKLRIVSALEGR
jgi:hypothetical protein